MIDGHTTLEDTAISSPASLRCWEHFDKSAQKSYIPASRPGWYDVGINGGDVDLIDVEE